MTIKNFIKHIVTFNNVDKILDTCKNQPEKGFIYERLWDICIKFGFCDKFPTSDYTNMIGNMNTGSLKTIKTFTKYLEENVISGNSSGCSDISLQNKNLEYVFISSKFPKKQIEVKKQKSVSYYDVPNIIAVCDANKHIYKNYKIYLLVDDKKSVLEKAKNANKSSEYITKHMTEQNILDKNDLNKCFLQFKSDIIPHINNDNINYDELYLSGKCKLSLRFHQELLTQKTCDLIESGHNRFLWGCKCRSGKTYMVGGIIKKLFDIKKKLNVLIILACPTETASQFTDDLFNKFKDFEPFKIHHITKSKKVSNVTLGESNIFIMSKPLLGKNMNDKCIKIIKNLKLDIIGFDENHHGGCSPISKAIVKSYESFNTVKIYLTATYNKPVREWYIKEECRMYWDIEDEKICKNILLDESNIDKLKDKHGALYIDNIIKYFNDKGLSINEIFTPYNNMPEFHLLTTMFDPERYAKIKEDIMGSKYGFSFNSLFNLNENKTKFKYPQEVKTVLQYISGSNKEIDFKNGDNSTFARISNVCAEKETRTPFTQLWFLPETNINEISSCLKILMSEDKILKKYNVHAINGKNKDLAKDVKRKINKYEQIAKDKGKQGVILLAGKMLQLGVTLDQCDVVMLLNNSLSTDSVFQQMYRCMTEGPNKKFGFVIDMNISRVINICINYTLKNNNTKNIEDKIKYLIENHLINIDVDMMDQYKLNSNDIIAKIMEIWKSNPINSFKTLLYELTNEYIEFDSEIQKEINKLFTKSHKTDTVNIKLALKNDNDELQELPSGITRTQADNKSNKEECTEEKKIEISFNKDVLKYIIPLVCILTIKTINKDFFKMLDDIQEDPELLEIFNEMCDIWWGQKILINFIKEVSSIYFNKYNNTRDFTIKIKMDLVSLIDYPKELLELINEYLKPTVKEKQENGAVYTPVIEIEELLDKLDTYYKNTYGRSIFTEINFKWFDPAVGMGNFIVIVYLRLMDGLAKQIQNKNDRKRHIIENMLYMSELNKYNCHVVKQIFNANGEYDLNLHEGDTLTINITKLWNLPLNSFDVVLGNPPYNKGGIRSHTGKQLGKRNETIWPKFIDQAFQLVKPDGFIVFINPLSWLKKSHSLHNTMLTKYIIWMKLWDNAQAKVSISAQIPISLYVLQNKRNKTLKKTTLKTELRHRGTYTKTSDEYLNPKYTIPLAYHNVFSKLIDFIEKNKLQLEYKTKTVRSSGIKTKLPSDYTTQDMWAIDTYTINNGIMVKKASEPHIDFDKRKIIIANKASFTGAFIDEGLLHLTGNHKYYILGDNLELILKLLGFKIMNIIGNYTKYGQDFLDNESFTYIPDIRKLGIADITEAKFYKLINLTNDEIKSL